MVHPVGSYCTDTKQVSYRGNTYIRHRRTKCSRHDEPVLRIYGEPLRDRLPYTLDTQKSVEHVYKIVGQQVGFLKVQISLDGVPWA
jgi:hypothetical protein